MIKLTFKNDNKEYSFKKEDLEKIDFFGNIKENDTINLVDYPQFNYKSLVKCIAFNNELYNKNITEVEIKRLKEIRNIDVKDAIENKNYKEIILNCKYNEQYLIQNFKEIFKAPNDIIKQCITDKNINYKHKCNNYILDEGLEPINSPISLLVAPIYFNNEEIFDYILYNNNFEYNIYMADEDEDEDEYEEMSTNKDLLHETEFIENKNIWYDTNFTFNNIFNDLYYACYKDNISFMKKLIEKNEYLCLYPRENIQFGKYTDDFYHGHGWEFNNITEIIENVGEKVPIELAVEKGNVEMIKLLMDISCSYDNNYISYCSFMKVKNKIKEYLQ